MSFRRRLMMAGGGALPYDAEVEYLETDGINPTGFELPIKVNRATDAFEITYQQTTNVNQARLLITGTLDTSTGLVDGDGVVNFYINGSGKYGLYTTTWANPINVTVGTYKDIVKIDYKNNKFCLNGYAANATDDNNLSSSNLYLMFGFRGYPLFKGKFYGFRFWRNDVLQMDCIPVRIGSVGYLYDKIGNTLYSNPCSGSFSLGADTGDISKFTRLDYVHSGIGAYIVTEYVPNYNTKIEFDMQMDSSVSAASNKYPAFFGIRSDNRQNSIAAYYPEKSTGYFVAQFGTTSSNIKTDIQFGYDRLVGELSKDGLIINGSTYQPQSTNSFTCPAYLQTNHISDMKRVADLHYQNNYSTQFKGYTYRLKIRDNGVLISDYVPVKNQQDVYGLYDLVKNKFYRSNSPTAFTGGYDN